MEQEFKVAINGQFRGESVVATAINRVHSDGDIKVRVEDSAGSKTAATLTMEDAIALADGLYACAKYARKRR